MEAVQDHLESAAYAALEDEISEAEYMLLAYLAYRKMITGEDNA